MQVGDQAVESRGWELREKRLGPVERAVGEGEYFEEFGQGLTHGSIVFDDRDDWRIWQTDCPCCRSAPAAGISPRMQWQRDRPQNRGILVPYLGLGWFLLAQARRQRFPGADEIADG